MQRTHFTGREKQCSNTRTSFYIGERCSRTFYTQLGVK